MMDTNAAVIPEEFDAIMEKLMPPAKIAVAVSGGGDSLALVLLLQDWVQKKSGELLALTVDHGLRSGSAAEALETQKLLRARGIAHEILDWQGDKPVTHIQEAARRARYDLLLNECRRRGFQTLAVAHNLEDRIETFWMRLAHGSGLDGLASMAEKRRVDGVDIIRPLLSFSRARLRETCRHGGIGWIEDPSNQNEKYLRVRLRGFEEMLAEEGMTPARLSQTLRKLGDACEALQETAERAIESSVIFHPEGYAELNVADWKNHPRDIRRRILSQALMTVSPQDYPPGFDMVEQTCLDLHNPAFAGKTLYGCEIFSQDGRLLFLREEAATEKRRPVQRNSVWDGRFSVSIRSESLEIGILGDNGLSLLRKNKKILPALEALPFKVRRVLPALWRGENPVAVPHVSYYSPECPPEAKDGKIVFAGKSFSM